MGTHLKRKGRVNEPQSKWYRNQGRGSWSTMSNEMGVKETEDHEKKYPLYIQVITDDLQERKIEENGLPLSLKGRQDAKPWEESMMKLIPVGLALFKSKGADFL